MDEAKRIFAIESAELLEDMEENLMLIEADPENSEAINSLFRAVHTIKGSSGIVGISHVEAFVHTVENILNNVREGECRLDSDLASTLLETKDLISAMIGSWLEDRPLDSSILTAHDTFILALNRYLSPRNAKQQPLMETNTPEPRTWHISIRFGRDMLRSCMDPISTLTYMARIVEIKKITTLYNNMPPASEMDAETCYIGVEVDIETALGQHAIEDMFDLIKEDCDIRITQTMIEPPACIATHKLSKPLTGDLRKTSSSIRVDTEKLDLLINMVGELVITGSNIEEHARRLRDSGLQQTSSALARLIEDIRSSAMGVRMIPLQDTLSRLNRTVHDIARETGKDIRLLIEGGDTELDKTIIEKIKDPLMHLVRNSVDHGIEPGAERIAKGKPSWGTITLRAYQDTSDVVIEISDDGQGLNRKALLDKAVSLCMISPTQTPTAEELHNLIFVAGFSTAHAVTNISGRGVGMDVVRRNITELRGSVEVQSNEGLGATFRIRIPLTLAIIEGFLVETAGSFFVVPMDMVIECVDLGAKDKEHEKTRHYIDLRGSALPYIRIREVFDLGAEAHPEIEPILIVRHSENHLGLVVDKLHGGMQVVIKNLGGLYKDVRWVSGATIMGNGTVALILDVPKLMQMANEQAVKRVFLTSDQ